VLVQEEDMMAQRNAEIDILKRRCEELERGSDTLKD
jgi:hypothetical protein